MPFRHVVMFRWADHVTDDHVDRVRDGLSALPAHIPQIRGYVHGPDLGVSEGSWDYVVVADFDHVADYRAYRDHPQHVLLMEEAFAGNLAERAAVQYLTPDPNGAHDQYGTAETTVALESVELGGQVGEESDDELLDRARRAAMAEMERMMAEPDELG